MIVVSIFDRNNDGIFADFKITGTLTEVLGYLKQSDEYEWEDRTNHRFRSVNVIKNDKRIVIYAASENDCLITLDCNIQAMLKIA